MAKPEHYDSCNSFISALRIGDFVCVLALKEAYPAELTKEIVSQIIQIIITVDFEYNSDQKLYEIFLESIEKFPESFDEFSVEDIKKLSSLMNEKNRQHQILTVAYGRYDNTYVVIDAVGKSIDEFIGNQINKDEWIEFLKFIQRDGDKTSPTKKWLSEIKMHANFKNEIDVFYKTVFRCFD